jgi:antitoxin component of MazEF toxin-antitoxin module
MRKRITQVENSGAIVLPPALLKQLSIEVGDEVEISVTDRALVLRSVADVAHDRKVERAVDDVCDRRKTLFTHLAAGDEDTTGQMEQAENVMREGWVLRKLAE